MFYIQSNVDFCFCFNSAETLIGATNCDLWPLMGVFDGADVQTLCQRSGEFGSCSVWVFSSRLWMNVLFSHRSDPATGRRCGSSRPDCSCLSGAAQEHTQSVQLHFFRLQPEPEQTALRAAGTLMQRRIYSNATSKRPAAEYLQHDCKHTSSYVFIRTCSPFAPSVSSIMN